jgi:hypothetical protein
MRLSYDGGRSYPRKLDRALSAAPPPVPAAVHIYDDHGMTRLLAADFDSKRAAGRGAADPAAQVSADAAGFAELVRACGGHGFGDVSPNGGRHGYVLWAAPLPFAEMRRMALALARRFVSYDPSPMLGREHGIIRPPGSRHRTGGHQLLTTPLAAAERCVTEPNGPAVWERLCEALSGDLDAIGRGEAPLPPSGPEAAPDGAQRSLDAAGMPWLPRAGGRVPALRPDLELTAVTGGYDTSRYPSPSEARMAVLCSAAARGWQLADVAGRLRSGAWAGLAGHYARYRPAQRAKSLGADWRKAVAAAAGGKSGRPDHTRGKQHTGGGPAPRVGPTRPGAEIIRSRADASYHGIRRWDSAVRAAERCRWPGAHGITVRLVLRALAAAAQMTGGTETEFGTRSLGMLACLDHSTVAQVLRELREEPDPFVDLVAGHRGVRGDLYALRIPEEYATAAAWRRWRPGRLGVHPVFRVLGGAAALVLEQLAREPARAMDLPLLTGLSATAVSEALADLGAHGLAERGPGGWRRGPADLDDVAAQLGVPEILAALQDRYRREREEWRGLLMLARSPAVAAPGEDVPWPEEPPPEDGYPALASARAPPGRDVLALLEEHLGPVEVVGVA